MITIAVQTLLFFLVLPVGLLLWQWLGVESCRLNWLLKSLLVGGYFAALIVIAPWSIAPYYLRYVYLALYVLLVVLTLPTLGRLPWWPAGGWGGWPVTGLYTLLALFFIGVTLYGLGGYRLPPVEPVKLALPLRGGVYLIVNAGSNPLLNPHLKTLNNQDYRGQSYALDILQLNAWGTRADGILPRELDRYRIFGEPVYAPCAGVVKSTENTLPDLTPPTMDKQNKPGNYVLLACQDAEVLLAHLRRGSVTVRPGTYSSVDVIMALVLLPRVRARLSMDNECHHEPQSETSG